MSLQPIWLTEDSLVTAFPDVEFALAQPNGLLAIGGDLSHARLLAAYRRGIFPWFSEGQPILWWAPDPRTVLLPEHLVVRRSLRKALRQGRFELVVDRAFSRVIRMCAGVRRGQTDTWITDRMVAAYENLHALGHAHSIEAWCEGELVGGLYGVEIGRVFFGESMFSTVSEASKAALFHLCSLGHELIDCQLPTDHLHSMGAKEMKRVDFTAAIQTLCDQPRRRRGLLTDNQSFSVASISE